jgi:hypothetical protein
VSLEKCEKHEIKTYDINVDMFYCIVTSIVLAMLQLSRTWIACLAQLYLVMEVQPPKTKAEGNLLLPRTWLKAQDGTHS